MTKQYLATVKAANGDVNRMPGYVYRTDAAGRQYLSALIKVSDAALADSALHALGVKDRHQSGRYLDGAGAHGCGGGFYNAAGHRLYSAR